MINLSYPFCDLFTLLFKISYFVCCIYIDKFILTDFIVPEAHG